MRKAMRWRYYCDFCKKVTGTRHSMEKHEKGCTANPNRVCGLCAIAGEVQRPMAELIAEGRRLFGSIPACQFPGPRADDAAKAFREFVHNCPACLLAAMRQSDSDVPWIYPFDFRAEVRAFLATVSPPEDYWV